MYNMETLQLPQLNICKEASPLGLSIILIELLDCLNTQVSSASETVGSCCIPPGGSEDYLVSQSEAEDDYDSNHVLEEVFGSKSGITL